MATPLVFAWLGLVSIIGLNGFAAGIVAILYAWRSGLRRRGRTLVAIAFAGLFSGSSFVGFVILGSDDGTTETGVLAGVFVFFFAVAMVLSVPGALIVARKLEAPGDEFRAFE